MDKILISKNEILVKWQKCLMDIKDRDKKLQVMRKALEDQKEFNLVIKNELYGVDNEKRKEMEVNGSLRSKRSGRRGFDVVRNDEFEAQRGIRSPAGPQEDRS